MSETSAPKGFVNKALDFIEKKGNKLPDPAILFLSLFQEESNLADTLKRLESASSVSPFLTV